MSICDACVLLSDCFLFYFHYISRIITHISDSIISLLHPSAPLSARNDGPTKTCMPVKKLLTAPEWWAHWMSCHTDTCRVSSAPGLWLKWCAKNSAMVSFMKQILRVIRAIHCLSFSNFNGKTAYRRTHFVSFLDCKCLSCSIWSTHSFNYSLGSSFREVGRLSAFDHVQFCLWFHFCVRVFNSRFSGYRTELLPIDLSTFFSLALMCGREEKPW